MRTLAKGTPALTCCTLASGLALGFLAGCKTSTYTLQVDAITRPAETGETVKSAGSYHIREDGLQPESSELRFKEVSDFIRTALSGKGMYEAPQREQADIIITIDYGMEAPRIRFDTMTRPVYVETKDQVTVSKEPVRDSSGMIVGYRDITILEKAGGSEILGMKTEIVPEIVYEKYLKISARENVQTAEGRAPAEVWSVNVSAEDTSKELRKYIPIMASATADYIGTNTKTAVPVKVGENDDAVKFVKRGL